MNPFAKKLTQADVARYAGASVARPAAGKRARKPAVKAPALPRPVDDIDLPAGPQVLGRVICPYPPAILNPNNRAHWSKKRPVAKAYRRECWAVALAAGLHLKTLPDGKIRVRLDFFPPDAARRDDDNAAASFKAGRDGIADAMKVDDSRFATSPEFHPEARACVVVTIMASDAQAGDL